MVPVPGGDSYVVQFDHNTKQRKPILMEQIGCPRGAEDVEIMIKVNFVTTIENW